jgi:hypothetical protein
MKKSVFASEDDGAENVCRRVASFGDRRGVAGRRGLVGQGQGTRAVG